MKINCQQHKIAVGLLSVPNVQLYDLTMLNESKSPYFVHTGHTLEDIGFSSSVTGLAWVSEMEDEILASSTPNSSLHVWSVSK